MAKRTNARPQKERKPKRAVRPGPSDPTRQLGSLAVLGEILKAIQTMPDDAFVTDPECEAITRLDRTTLWRIENGLDRKGRKEFAPEPLLKSYKLGPKRKVRQLGNLRKYVASRMNAQAV